MGSQQYTLDENHNPILEPDLMAWAMWFGQADRTVAKTQVENAEVSTVFLGLDHSFGLFSTPILFETMVFGSDNDEVAGMTTRTATWDEAVEQHNQTVNELRAALKEDTHE